jgi:hypothetical protein
VSSKCNNKNLWSEKNEVKQIKNRTLTDGGSWIGVVLMVLENLVFGLVLEVECFPIVSVNLICIVFYFVRSLEYA